MEMSRWAIGAEILDESMEKSKASEAAVARTLAKMNVAHEVATLDITADLYAAAERDLNPHEMCQESLAKTGSRYYELLFPREDQCTAMAEWAHDAEVASVVAAGGSAGQAGPAPVCELTATEGVAGRPPAKGFAIYFHTKSGCDKMAKWASQEEQADTGHSEALACDGMCPADIILP